MSPDEISTNLNNINDLKLYHSIRGDREKLAQRVCTHTALEAEGLQRGDHQAHSPSPPDLCVPQASLWQAASTLPRLP